MTQSGRVKTYEAIVKGENVPEPGVPESFKVLIKELQSLGLDVRLFSENDEELEIKESVEEGIDFNLEEGKEILPEEMTLENDEEGELIEEDILLDDEEDFDDIEGDIEDLEEEMLEEDIFDNDLAEDNIANDEDLLDE